MEPIEVGPRHRLRVRVPELLGLDRGLVECHLSELEAGTTEGGLREMRAGSVTPVLPVATEAGSVTPVLPVAIEAGSVTCVLPTAELLTNSSRAVDHRLKLREGQMARQAGQPAVRVDPQPLRRHARE